MLSHLWWSRIFKTRFAPQLSAIVQAVESRLLPAFDGIDKEAEAVSDQMWESFMESPGSGDEDLSELAEAAQEAGVSYYLMLTGVRQGMLNLFAAALYHTFEQQVMLFHRKQVLCPWEENNPSFFRMGEFQKRLNDFGIDITTFSSWQSVDELRLVANTVKHAQGDSAQKLHHRRPDLFQHPQSQKLDVSSHRIQPRVFLPLVGEDLYLSIQDIKQYRESVSEFWHELANAMRRS